MAASIQKHVKYSKALAVEFFNLCQQGLTLTQIAEQIGIDKSYLIKWSTDPQKFDWQNAWIRGKQAFQAFHERLVDDMIKNGKNYDAASKKLQQWRMEHLFDDWKVKPIESKVEVTQNQQTPEQMREEITRLLSKTVIRDQVTAEIESGNLKTYNNYNEMLHDIDANKNAEDPAEAKEEVKEQECQTTSGSKPTETPTGPSSEDSSTGRTTH